MGGARGSASPREGEESIRGILIYFVLIPAVVMVVLGLLRFRFAIRFWQQMYILGLVYVAIVLVRLVIQVLG